MSGEVAQSDRRAVHRDESGRVPIRVLPVQDTGHIRPRLRPAPPLIDSGGLAAEREKLFRRRAGADDADEERKRREAGGEPGKRLSTVGAPVQTAGDGREEVVRHLDLQRGIDMRRRADRQADPISAEHLVEHGRFAEPDPGAVVLQASRDEALRRRGVWPRFGSTRYAVGEVRDQTLVVRTGEDDVLRRRGERVRRHRDAAIGTRVEEAVRPDGERVQVGVDVRAIDVRVRGVVRQPVREDGPRPTRVEGADDRQLAADEDTVGIRGVDEKRLVVPSLHAENIEGHRVRVRVLRPPRRVDVQGLEAQPSIVAAKEIELRTAVDGGCEQVNPCAGGIRYRALRRRQRGAPGKLRARVPAGKRSAGKGPCGAVVRRAEEDERAAGVGRRRCGDVRHRLSSGQPCVASGKGQAPHVVRAGDAGNDERYVEPAGAAVGAPEQARVGCRQDHGAISRIHLDVRHRARGQRPGGGPDRVCGRHSRGGRPRAPAVGAAGNAWLPHVEWIAESKEKDVWIRRVHRERTDRGGADGVSEWFPEDHRCGCSGCLPDPPTRSGEIKDVGVHRVRQDTAGTPGVDLCISVAVHRVVGARRTEVHERAARRCREPLRARKGPALADRVPVPLSLRRVENPRPAGDVVARPVTRRPQPRRRIVQLDCRRPCNGCSEQDRREQDGCAGAQAFPPGFGNANTRRRGPQANRRRRRSAQAVGRRNRDSCAGSAAIAGKFLWG